MEISLVTPLCVLGAAFLPSEVLQLLLFSQLLYDLWLLGQVHRFRETTTFPRHKYKNLVLFDVCKTKEKERNTEKAPWSCARGIYQCLWEWSHLCMFYWVYIWSSNQDPVLSAAEADSWERRIKTFGVLARHYLLYSENFKRLSLKM